MIKADTYEEWLHTNYGIVKEPIEPFEVWQANFTAYIAAKPKQFTRIDKRIAQLLFDKATAGVIAQGGPSYLGKYSFDSIASYFSYRNGKIFKCPIGHILSNEQVIKYNIGPGKFICDWKEDLIIELLPNSSVVCARHFISKLEKAHTRSYVRFKQSKEQSNFVSDFIVESNIVAKSFGLKEISLLPTPKNIIHRALELLAHHNWRQSIYMTINTKGKTTHHVHDLPCMMCDTRIPLIGLTVQDALLKAFNAYSPPMIKAGTNQDGSILSFGDTCSDKESLRKLLSDHDKALFETKCLIARMDPSIHIKEVDMKDGYLYPIYIDIPEWNDRRGQTKEHVTHILQLALAGNVPNEKGS